MADVKTSAETDATVLTGAEQVRITQGGNSRKTIAALMGHQFRGVRARMSTDDTAQNVTADTAVGFDLADFDTDTFWSAGSPTRITIPASLGIDYVELTAQAYVTSGTADTVFSVQIWHYNSANTLLKIFGIRHVEGGNTARMGQATTGPVLVSDSDYFVMNIQQETDTSVTIEGDDLRQTYMALTVIGMVP